MTLGGVQYHDNDTIDILGIGENNSALICQTDLRPCCRSSGFRAGEWYYPNGTVVLIEGTGESFYRNRGDDGTVRLNRRYYVNYPTGTYRCEIPDASNTIRTLHIRILDYIQHVGRLQL